MENHKKQNAQGTCLTLKECLTNPDYLKALAKMEQAQKRYLQMTKGEDIEPIDWEVLDV